MAYKTRQPKTNEVATVGLSKDAVNAAETLAASPEGDKGVDRDPSDNVTKEANDSVSATAVPALQVNEVEHASKDITSVSITTTRSDDDKESMPKAQGYVEDDAHNGDPEPVGKRDDQNEPTVSKKQTKPKEPAVAAAVPSQRSKTKQPSSVRGNSQPSSPPRKLPRTDSLDDRHVRFQAATDSQPRSAPASATVTGGRPPNAPAAAALPPPPIVTRVATAPPHPLLPRGTMPQQPPRGLLYGGAASNIPPKNFNPANRPEIAQAAYSPYANDPVPGPATASQGVQHPPALGTYVTLSTAADPSQTTQSAHRPTSVAWLQRVNPQHISIAQHANIARTEALRRFNMMPENREGMASLGEPERCFMSLRCLLNADPTSMIDLDDAWHCYLFAFQEFINRPVQTPQVASNVNDSRRQRFPGFVSMQEFRQTIRRAFPAVRFIEPQQVSGSTYLAGVCFCIQ